MRYLLQKLRAALVTGYNRANSPIDRFYAILDANFDDALFTVEQCSLWVQFWASAPYQPCFARIQEINRQRVRSHFRAELKHLVPDTEVDVVRRALQSYMDGVWLQATHSEGALNAMAARAEARRVADLLLGRAV